MGCSTHISPSGVRARRPPSSEEGAHPFANISFYISFVFLPADFEAIVAVWMRLIAVDTDFAGVPVILEHAMGRTKSGNCHSKFGDSD